MGRDSLDMWVMQNCPPESGGQRGRIATKRGVVPQTATPTFGGLGTTPALRVTPPDSGGDFFSFPVSGFLAHVA